MKKSFLVITMVALSLCLLSATRVAAAPTEKIEVSGEFFPTPAAFYEKYIEHPSGNTMWSIIWDVDWHGDISGTSSGIAFGVTNWQLGEEHSNMGVGLEFEGSINGKVGTAHMGINLHMYHDGSTYGRIKIVGTGGDLVNLYGVISHGNSIYEGTLMLQP